MQTAVITKYGVTEKKKTELDDLVIKVRNAEDEVEQLQAVVNSLSAKFDKLQAELVIAKANEDKGLANKKMVDSIVLNVKDHVSDSELAKKRMGQAEDKIQKAASQMSTLIEELIYSAELINKLADLIVRKKASNPLISDELITRVTSAGTDANSAVALTLTALQSIFTSQATNVEGQNVVKLENKYAKDLNGLIKYRKKGELKEMNLKKFELTSDHEKYMNVSDMLLQAYNDYKKIYNSTLAATDDTSEQLTEANIVLDNAVVNLDSLRASLAAAQAAALAS